MLAWNDLVALQTRLAGRARRRLLSRGAVGMVAHVVLDEAALRWAGVHDLAVDERLGAAVAVAIQLDDASALPPQSPTSQPRGAAPAPGASVVATPQPTTGSRLLAELLQRASAYALITVLVGHVHRRDGCESTQDGRPSQSPDVLLAVLEVHDRQRAVAAVVTESRAGRRSVGPAVVADSEELGQFPYGGRFSGLLKPLKPYAQAVH